MTRFFKSCWHCSGSGDLILDEEKPPVECGECEGRGFFLTEAGEELEAFLRKLGVVK